MPAGAIDFVKQADGFYAVRRGGTLLGIVGHDAYNRGWFATQSKSQRQRGSLSASYFYVNGMRTRQAAADALIEWHDASTPPPLQLMGGQR
jgi:hypothetical protein